MPFDIISATPPESYSHFRHYCSISIFNLLEKYDCLRKKIIAVRITSCNTEDNVDHPTSHLKPLHPFIESNILFIVQIFKRLSTRLYLLLNDMKIHTPLALIRIKEIYIWPESEQTWSWGILRGWPDFIEPNRRCDITVELEISL